MRTLRLFVVGLAFAAVAAMSGWSAAQAQPSGVVLAVVQSAQVDSTTGKRTLQTEAPVYSGDRIVTGAIGEAQVRFRDNTKLVVGPNSTLVIDAFVFSDNNTARQISINAVRGAFRFITGNSRKDAYSITTPTATIGVRGTEFDVNVASDGQTSVAQYEGKTIICTRRPDDPAAAAQWRKRCVEVADNCGVSIVSPNAKDIQRIRGREERDFNLASFRYVRSQASLRREFRVDISGACGPIIFAALFNNPSNETLPEPPPPPTPPPPTDHPTEYTCEPKHHYFPKWPVHHPKDGEEEGYHPPRGPWHPKGDGEEEARLPFKKHFGDAPEGRSGYASWTKPGESEKFGDRGGEHRTLAFGIGGPEKSGRPDGEHRFGGDKPGFGDKPSGFTGLFTPPGNTRGVGGFEGGGGGFPGWHKPSGERTVAGFGEKPGPSGVGGFEKPKTFGGWSDKPASGPCTCQHTGEEGGGGGGARTAGTTWGKPPVTTTAFTGGDDKGDKSFRGPGNTWGKPPAVGAFGVEEDDKDGKGPDKSARGPGNTWGKPPVVASFGTEEDDKDGKGPGKGSRGPGNTWGKPPVVASFGAPPDDKEVDKTVSPPEEAPAVVAAVTEEDKPVADKPGSDKPGSDKPVAFGFDKGNGDQDKGFGFGSKSGPSSFDKGPGDSKSPFTKPSDKSADKGSFGDKPSGKATKPSGSKPPVEKTAPPVEETVTPPVVETLAVVETPPAAEAAEAPATVAEAPAEAPAAAAAEAPAEAPAAEAPAAEAPAAEAPAAEAPAAEAPAAEAPAAEAPAAEAPAAEAPASAPAEAPAASSSESAPAQSSGGSSESSSSQSSGGGSSDSSSSSSGGGDSSSSSSSSSESAPAPAPEASAPPAEAAPAEAAPAG